MHQSCCLSHYSRGIQETRAEVWRGNPASIGQRFAKRSKEKQEAAFENEFIKCGRTGIQKCRRGNSCSETKHCRHPSFAKLSPQANGLAGNSSCRHPHDGGDSESARVWSSRQFNFVRI